MKLFSFFSKRAQVSKRFTVKIRNYLLNSYCKDKEGDEIARGGSALFQNGEICAEIPSGREGILLVEI